MKSRDRRRRVKAHRLEHRARQTLGVSKVPTCILQTPGNNMLKMYERLDGAGEESGFVWQRPPTDADVEFALAEMGTTFKQFSQRIAGSTLVIYQGDPIADRKFAHALSDGRYISCSSEPQRKEA